MSFPAARAESRSSFNRAVVAFAAAAVAAILTAIGQFSGGAFADEWAAWLIELMAIAAVTALVFAFVVPRTLHRRQASATARAALLLGVVGFLSSAVFWLGLPVPLAAGAAYLADSMGNDTQAAEYRPYAVAAMVLAIVTVVIAILLAFLG